MCCMCECRVWVGDGLLSQPAMWWEWCVMAAVTLFSNYICCHFVVASCNLLLAAAGKTFYITRLDSTQRNLTRHFILKFDAKRRAFSHSPMSSGLTFIKYHFDKVFFCCCASYTGPHYMCDEMANSNHLMKFVVASTVCKCCSKCCKFCMNFKKIEVIV